ncbi:uncharacterized protein JCM6883_001856 [Sporobolomyces salmoneus]|uniref:uncharacterized protein n=1 Tax=Sporobolomyces salmoneus TaxID=183962 RepID=UPI003176644F
MPSPASHDPSTRALATKLHLEPLNFNQVGFLYLEKEHKCIQYSFRAARESAEDERTAVALYDGDVKEEVANLVAAFVHSLSHFRSLSCPVRLSSSNGFYLELSLAGAHKLQQDWVWLKDDEEIEMSDIKVRFKLGITRNSQ